MTYSALEKGGGQLVTHVFQSPHSVSYPYHNLQHTKAVVEHAQQIAAFYHLGEKDYCIISLAAWFHDVGQLFGAMQGHEERSAQIMENYFASSGEPAPELIVEIKDCIMATKQGSLPTALNQKILCDADTWHFGTAYFHETEFLVQKEMEQRTGNAPGLWHQGSLEMLKHHVYFTEYAQLLLGEGKEANIQWLQSLIETGD